MLGVALCMRPVADTDWLCQVTSLLVRTPACRDFWICASRYRFWLCAPCDGSEEAVLRSLALAARLRRAA